MVQYFPVITGSLTVSGSIIVTEGISMSGSIASSSYAATASFVTLSQTASFVTTAQTASFVTTAQTASFVTTAQTASYVLNAQSASNAVVAQTASYASSLTVAGTLTAQTLVVQTITSSVDFVTGSTKFGSLSSNTHVFTGSMSVSGGLAVNAGNVGIGTTPPSNKLTVYGTGDLSYIYNSGASTTDANFYIYNSTTDILMIRNSGNVGIGTGNPAYKLTVDGGSSDGNIGIERDTVGTNTVIGALNFTNNNGGTAYGRVRGGRNSAGDGYVSLGTGASGDTVFIMENGRMQLQYAATPNYTGSKFFLSRSDQYGLHLEAAAGYVRLRGDDDYIYISRGSTNVITIDPNNRVGIGNSSPQGTLHIGSALASSGDAAAITLKQTGTNETTGIYLERSGERKGYAIYVGGSLDSLVFQRNNAGTKSDVMTLTRDGNVGINQQNPTGLGGPTLVVAGSGYPEVIVEKTGTNARKWGFTVGSDGSYLLRDYTSGTNVFTVSTSGASTFSSSVTAGGRVVGTGFKSYSGEISIASGVTSTIYTMGDNGLYTVQIIVGGGSLIYSAAAIFYAHSNNGQFVKTIDLYDGANVTLDQSSGAIRITNNGFATLTWNWSIIFQAF